MKRNIQSIIRLTVSMLLTIATILPHSQVCAASNNYSLHEVNALYNLGLVNGTWISQDETPEFALSRPMTRNEATVMLARFLGAEKLSTTYTSPFTDVPSWARHCVGYAYTTGMTKGISETTFGGDLTIDKNQFCALILRSLGYSDANGDFSWSDAAVFAQSLGLASADENGTFTRGDAFHICYDALFTYNKSQTETLLQRLYATNVITLAQIHTCGLSDHRFSEEAVMKKPVIPEKFSISDIDEYLSADSIFATSLLLQRYLDANVKPLDTPMGTYTPRITVSCNSSYSFWEHDFEITTNYPSFEYNFRKHSEEDKAETVRLLKEFQKELYEMASGFVPGAKLKGGYDHSGYTYKYIRQGYYHHQDCTWKNYSDGYGYENTYVTEFSWTPVGENHFGIFKQ